MSLDVMMDTNRVQEVVSALEGIDFSAGSEALDTIGAASGGNAFEDTKLNPFGTLDSKKCFSPT